MGFMDAMKGANLNFGTVDSPDFIACYLTTKGDHFMITGMKTTYEFYKSDVVLFDVLASGGEWIKYRIKFKDGKIGIITSSVETQTQKKERGQSVSVAPIERFFADLLFINNANTSFNKISNDNSEKTIP